MLIQITSPAASGKSHSFKTLNPSETFIINADGSKGLSYAGWRKDYNAERKNYYECNEVEKVKAVIKGIVDSRPDIKVICVDTLTVLLEEALLTDKSRNQLDKFRSYGDLAYELYRFCSNLRRPGTEDLFIVFCAHSDYYKALDPAGNEVLIERTKFAGFASAKATLTKYLNYNIKAFVDSTEEVYADKFKFATVSNGKDEIRATSGVLPPVMPNSLGEVIRLIRKYDLELPDTNAE